MIGPGRYTIFEHAALLLLLAIIATLSLIIVVSLRTTPSDVWREVRQARDEIQTLTKILTEHQDDEHPAEK